MVDATKPANGDKRSAASASALSGRVRMPRKKFADLEFRRVGEILVEEDIASRMVQLFVFSRAQSSRANKCALHPCSDKGRSAIS